MGKATAPSGGKDGNLHLGNPDRGVISAISMLGALVPVMAGVALAARMQRRTIVAMTYIGDGGTSTGPFHEGMNFAGVQKLPLVVVAENNGWAYSTPLRKQTAALEPGRPRRRPTEFRRSRWTATTSSRSTPRAAARSTGRGRAKGRPLVEAVTYRMKGHAEHDNQEYVPKQELEAWIRRDPIEAILPRRSRSRASRVARSSRRSIAQLSAEVERDADLADRDPYPAPESALSGVYAEAPRTPADAAVPVRR